MQYFGAVAAVAAVVATGVAASEPQGANGIYGPAPTFGQLLTPIAIPTNAPEYSKNEARDAPWNISPGLGWPNDGVPKAGQPGAETSPFFGLGPEIPPTGEEINARALDQTAPAYGADSSSAAATEAPTSSSAPAVVTVTISADTCTESSASAAAEATTTSTIVSEIDVTSTAAVASTETLASTVTSILSLAPATFSTAVGSGSISGYFNSTTAPCTTSSVAALAGSPTATAAPSASASFTAGSSNGTAPIQPANAAGSLRAPGLFKFIAKLLF